MADGCRLTASVQTNMVWDPTLRPCLRPLQAFPLPDGDGAAVAGIRDQSGLSDVILTLSEPALRIMALMDGTNTCEDIRRKFLACSGRALPTDTLQLMLEQLGRANFLEGPGFESYYQSRMDEYRTKGTREMPHAAALRVDGSGDLFDEMLTSVPADGGLVLPGRVIGLVAPHLDYPRGKACYAAAYATLRNRSTPDRVVILGTNHFGRSTSVVATTSDFATPLGTTHTDVAFLELLEERCGNLRTYELDHLPEHSVELQLAWLQHFFGAGSFEMVPFLCPDPCGPTGTAPSDGNGVDLREFALALGELIRDDRRDTMVIAGADLSHVGAAFGDKRTLDESFLDEVRRHDRRVLEHVSTPDPGCLLRCIAEQNNHTRICSAGCIFVLMTALPDAVAAVLGYHQAADQSSQTCVTCAAVAFTERIANEE